MSKREIKYIVIAALGCLVLAVGVAYSMAIVTGTSVPFMQNDRFEADFSYQDKIIGQWKNAETYTPVDMEQIVKVDIPEVEGALTASDILTMFPEIDKSSYDSYLAQHPEIVVNKRGDIYFDNADLDNKYIGLKTANGDEVLALDTYDGIMVVGIKIGATNCKLIFVNDKSKIGLSVVPDLDTWEEAEWHSKKERALVAINASEYKYYEKQEFKSLIGLTLKNGNLIRKSSNESNTIGIGVNGEIYFGKDCFGRELSHGFEAVKVYNFQDERQYFNKAAEAAEVPISTDTNIDETVKVVDVAATASPSPSPDSGASPEITPTPTPERYSKVNEARSALAINSYGRVMLFIAEGGEAGGQRGCTEEAMLKVLDSYGAVNGASLSGGIKSVMYWNGRVINRGYGYDVETLKLPVMLVVKKEYEAKSRGSTELKTGLTESDIMNDPNRYEKTEIVEAEGTPAPTETPEVKPTATPAPRKTEEPEDDIIIIVP